MKLMPFFRNFKFEILNLKFFSAKQKGFTLVELLIVLGLVSATVATILIFLTATLKGSNQAAVTSELKQNGQVILDQLERQIRGATLAKLVDYNHLKLVTPNSATGVLHIKCFPSTSSLNGYIGTSTDTTTDTPVDAAYTSLTNKNDLISGINVSSCSLSVVPGSSGGIDPPVVSMNFSLSNGLNANALRPDLKGNASFQSTISLRQLGQ